MTLKQLLRFTYAHQQADVAAGYTLDDLSRASSPAPEDAALSSWLGRMVELGARIDGGERVIWADRHAVHPDALKVHEVVMESLSATQIATVITVGREGLFPEAADHLPRPGPHDPARFLINDPEGRYRSSWGVYEGVRTPVLIKIIGIDHEERTIWRRSGRGRMVPVGTETVAHAVEMCPVRWFPDVAWYQMVCDIDGRWQAIVAKLEAKLAEVTLVAHELVPSGD